jgi:hypothetical protein
MQWPTRVMASSNPLIVALLRCYRMLVSLTWLVDILNDQLVDVNSSFLQLSTVCQRTRRLQATAKLAQGMPFWRQVPGSLIL